MPQKKVQLIKLQCSECKKINYYKKKSKRGGKKRLELKKYCKFCKKHTIHKEVK